MEVNEPRGKTGKLYGSDMAKAMSQGQADYFGWGWGRGLPLSFISRYLLNARYMSSCSRC